MILNELWKILCVIGMIAGIGFCAVCILMCVLIGVMVIRACVGDEDDGQPGSVSVNKEEKQSGAQLDAENELNWPDGEENENEEEKVWLVRENGNWVSKEGKKVYMKVGEGEKRDEQVQ